MTAHFTAHRARNRREIGRPSTENHANSFCLKGFVNAGWRIKTLVVDLDSYTLLARIKWAVHEKAVSKKRRLQIAQNVMRSQRAAHALRAVNNFSVPASGAGGVNIARRIVEEQCLRWVEV